MQLPPFAKPLYDLHMKGQIPLCGVWLFLGKDSWAKGKAFSISYPARVLAIPPWNSALTYYWPVRDCDILMVDTGFSNDDYLDEVASCIYEFDAKIVRLITFDNALIIYHKEVSK